MPGVDGDFENVGGMILDVVMSRLNAFGRIALCGMISGYDGKPIPMARPALLLTQRLKLQGFIVSEHMALWPEALKELTGEEKMDATAIIDYYAPLKAWLDEQNRTLAPEAVAAANPW